MSHLSSSNEGDEHSCCESENEILVDINQPLASSDQNQPIKSEDSAIGSTSFGPTKMATEHEERMRRRLQFFFMNPIQKWKAKRKFPYKFFVQVS